jgi:hypothetical protein
MSVLLASLVSIAAFEPIGNWLRDRLFLANEIFAAQFLWCFLLLGIFAFVSFVMLRGYVAMVPESPTIAQRTERVGTVFTAGLTGYLLASFLLTAVHTLPADRDFSGVFPPEAHRRAGPIARIAPDYQFLGLVEYVANVRRPSSAEDHGEVEPTEVQAQPADALGSEFASDTGTLPRTQWSWFPIRYAVWRQDLHLSTEPDAQEQEWDEYAMDSDASLAPEKLVQKQSPAELSY